jgi:hypothetical protein
VRGRGLFFFNPRALFARLFSSGEVSAMFRRRLFQFSAAAALAAFGAAECLAQGKESVRSINETKKSGDSSRFTWIETDDGATVKVSVEGRVAFADDYSDVRDIPGEGRLIVEDNRERGAERRYRVERGAGGGLRRTYHLNGSERQLDDAGREWLRRTLLQAVRQGGFDARPRARKILSERGPRGLSEEIAQLRGDYTRRIYFEELLTAPGLDERTLADALRGAARLASDYERAQLLIRAADPFLSKGGLVPAYFEAVGRIASDYERRRVLSNAVRRAGLGGDALAAAIRASAGIRSDYEKATFLIQVARLGAGDERVRAAFAEAVGTISSAHERGRVEKAAARPGATN